MLPHRDPDNAGAQPSRRLSVRNGGFLTQRRLRRILSLKGYRITLAAPRPGDAVAVWGKSPTAHRGEALAARHGAPLVRIEDAFLRSLFPGRSGEPPLGLLIDTSGVHFDPSVPSDLERLLADHPLDDSAMMARARGAIARLRDAHLTKYAATDPDVPLPEPGYVLVIDQTLGDASVVASGADRNRFLEMLFVAREENPGARIVIKSHPETARGHRPGHFTNADAAGPVTLYDAAASPWALLGGATAVYTVSSQMGFEAILADHRPRVFGQPFYAGWGLTDDEVPLTRRQRRLTRAQLFAAAMILYPIWYDPYRDALGTLEDVLAALETQVTAWREDRAGWSAGGMRLWKRGHLQRFFGQHRSMVFSDRPVPGRPHMAWSNSASGDAARLEDGFLRSRGLGAELTPPLSLVLDRSGIHYDPTTPSDLEAWITRRATLRPDQRLRAEALIDLLTRNNLTKYNLGGALPDLPPGHLILVPGQVEDDASILRGTDEVRTNAALLARVRADNPDAVILYKTHPDVAAGLRAGRIADPHALADLVVDGVDMAVLLGAVDAVWTMTSLTGFEALLRGLPVTTLGAPFYAGWGLTRDLGTVPLRRQARPDLAGLVHAALIDYPRYRDPVTGLPCPVEIVAERLARGEVPRPGPFNRSLSKLQGLLAGQTHVWRR